MGKSWCRTGYMLLVLALVGCQRTRVADPEPPQQPTDEIAISLADWLKKPRSDLAALTEKHAEILAQQRQIAQEHPESVRLLPNLRFPTTVALFQEAHYSAQAGFSLPPYLKAGVWDAAVSWHLARHGDLEAARKLADPADRDLMALLESAKTQKQYPLEWTRVVSLVQQSAERKLAAGQKEGAIELIDLHRQLVELLDPVAARGPLGACLLSRGKRALRLAARAWRHQGKLAEAADDQRQVADKIDRALEDWAQVPEVESPWLAQGGQQQLARIFQQRPQDERDACQTTTPAQVQRVVDLLALPLPATSLASVLVLTPGQEVRELVLVYDGRAADLCPEPTDLAYELLERDAKPRERTRTPGTQQQVFVLGSGQYDITCVEKNRALGAVVRLKSAKAPVRQGTRPLTTLGPVDFRRSFEQQRLRIAPRESGSRGSAGTSRFPLKPWVALREPGSLRPFSVLGTPAPQDGELHRHNKEGGRNLLGSVRLRWPVTVNHEVATQLLLPLWRTLGSPVGLRGMEGRKGDMLIVEWAFSDGRVQLHLPSSPREPELLARHSGALEGDVSGWIARVQAFDEAERQARLKAGKPDQRLPRSVGVLNGIDLSRVSLGTSRSQALRLLPRTHRINQSNFTAQGDGGAPGDLEGVSLVFLSPPNRQAPYWGQQLLVRFGKEDRVSEIRIRYRDRLRAPTPEHPSLLRSLEQQTGTSPEPVPASWARLWADLPAPEVKPECYRWIDDFTVLTCQRDAGGAEVTLRPRGTSSEPLLFCGRGVKGCQLGDSQQTIRNRWGTKKPQTTAEGGWMLGTEKESPYNLVLVWFTNGKASRILARHRLAKPVQPRDVPTVLQSVWGRHLATRGALRRKDKAQGLILGAYGWHDDRVRIRTFAREGASAMELFTEWRTWPVLAK